MKPASRLKAVLYGAFVRHAWFRVLVAAARRLFDRRFPSFAHFAVYRPNLLGPIQPEEAHLLYGLVQVIHPRTIVEFGFHRGQSTLGFLAACPGARVFSYDIDPEAVSIARRHFGRFDRFTLVNKSQADFDPADVGGGPVDFVFIDASHDLALNQATFSRLLPHLSGAAVVAIHDTGVWRKDQFEEVHREAAARAGKRNWLDDSRFQNEPDERRFANWIAEAHPDFSLLHLGTERVLRHGLTLVQRRALLPT